MAEFHSDTPNVLLFEYMPFGSQTVTAIVSRGPELYKYPPYTFWLRSNCDITLRSGVNITLEWMEPCALVEFAGPIGRTMTFTINKLSE
jgi:hypothetical protein